VNGDADVVVMTTEVLRNMLYARGRAAATAAATACAGSPTS
jgi:superfamily II RNA helicase